MTSENLRTPARALAVGAHPDDVEFGCGGTLAKWAAAGCEISHLICTDGSKGSWDPADDPAALVASRQVEQRAASVALGGSGDVVFLGWRDGELESGLRQRADVCFWIRKLRPDVVLGHDPWKRYRLHPDHRHAGLLAVEGIVAARDPHFFPEQSVAPHRPSSLLLWEADEADHVEDITSGLDRKLAALLEHRSQYRTTMDIDDPGAADQAERFREKIRARHADAGRVAGMAYAEQFKLLDKL
ncbi:MAG TPA: PIG-L family deacetylase [Acidimicrobiales bacterium]|jgi:LmbE family N-acetylglucosaminyl deacetylase|nr:PIG-L family deacetylase [Acidimicrobiales bacterium]